MDVRCMKCGEPWDLDEFHEEAALTGETFQQVQRRFRRQGCSALDGAQCNSVPCEDETGMAVIAAAFEVMGDDVDGIASELADWGL